MKNRKKDVKWCLWAWLGALLAAVLLQQSAYAELSVDEAFSKKIFTKPQYFTDIKLLTNNADALKYKLHLIKTAEHTIDMIYFIWEDDFTSSLLMQNLMLKADEGKKVRIMVDYLMTEGQVPSLLTLANHLSGGKHNIEVRRFRPPAMLFVKNLRREGIDANKFLYGFMAFNKDKILESIAHSKLKDKVDTFVKEKDHDLLDTLQFVLDLLKHNAPLLAIQLNNFVKRSHYKLTVVDGKRFIMGGRNISDQYHVPEGHDFLYHRNTSPYAFADTEVAATEGPNDHSNQDGFDGFWNFQPLKAKVGHSDVVDVRDASHYYDEMGQKLPPPMDVNVIYARADKARQAGFDDYNLSPSTVSIPGPIEGQIFENGPQSVLLTLPTPQQREISPYVSDTLARFYNSQALHREIAHEYVNLINAAKERIDIVSAYFYIDDGFLDKDFTAIYKSLINRATVDRPIPINIFTNSPASTDLKVVNYMAYRTYPTLNQAHIYVYELGPDQGSLHTKVMSIDDNILAVGSFNLDPRSQMYDTNNIIVLKDDSQVLVRAFRKYRGVNLDNDPEGLKWFIPDPAEVLKDHIPLPPQLDPAVDALRNSI